MKHQTNPAKAFERIYSACNQAAMSYRVGTVAGTIYSDRFKRNLQTDFFISHSGFRLTYGSIRNIPTKEQQEKTDEIVNYANKILNRS